MTKMTDDERGLVMGLLVLSGAAGSLTRAIHADFGGRAHVALRDGCRALRNTAAEAAEEAYTASTAPGATDEFKRVMRGYDDSPTHEDGEQILNDGLERYNA